MSRIRTYASDDIEVMYDVKRCIHAAECVNRLPSVFDPEARPWVQPGLASADEVAATIARCPTGALSYRRLDGGAEEDSPGESVVQLVVDGPVYVHASITLDDPSGRGPARATRVALCRCGASKNKPFCDNSHKEVGFST